MRNTKLTKRENVKARLGKVIVALTVVALITGGTLREARAEGEAAAIGIVATGALSAIGGFSSLFKNMGAIGAHESPSGGWLAVGYISGVLNTLSGFVALYVGALSGFGCDTNCGGYPPEAAAIGAGYLTLGLVNFITTIWAGSLPEKTSIRPTPMIMRDCVGKLAPGAGVTVVTF